MLDKVLIANRGEIALRVLRACKELGIKTVAVHSTADKDLMHVRLSDECVCIGPPSPTDSYLNIPAIISAMEVTDADAVHPGYGFLSENADFAEQVENSGFAFIGPQAETIRLMGDKVSAIDVMRDAGVPTVPGSNGPLDDNKERTLSLAREIGYPVIIKAAAGGGGRGMRVVHNEAALLKAVYVTQTEAKSFFGSGVVYLEKFLENPRHVEIQVLGDGQGKAIHLGDRDCSLQRRYQKVVEEAPATSIPDALIADIRASAVTIAREIGYVNAGTVEFIVDRDNGAFFFLEMNTRIQVEHPISEMITGLDLVRQQIHIAGGAPLSFGQSDIRFSGHAIECRVNAEVPGDGFRPSPGRITAWRPPEMAGLRLDTHCHEGAVITPYYDSLLAKLIVHGASRLQAVARLQAALDDFRVDGVETTLPFLRRLARELNYLQGSVNTGWLELNLDCLT